MSGNTFPFEWDAVQDNTLLSNLFTNGTTYVSDETYENIETLTYGETVRGMKYVSPLVTQIQKRVPVNEIKDRYFPDGKSAFQDEQTVVCDVNSEFEGVSSTLKTGYQYGRTGNETLFRVYVFYSKDAIKLKEAHDCLEAKGDEVVFFIEDNTRDYSPRYASVKISTQVKERLVYCYRYYPWLIENSNLYKHLQELFPQFDLTTDEISNLMHNGELVNKSLQLGAEITVAIYRASKLLFHISTGFIFYWAPDDTGLISSGLEQVVSFINLAKIDDYHWDPDVDKFKEDGAIDPTYDKKKFQPFLLPGVEQAIDTLAGNTANDANQRVHKATQKLRITIKEQDEKVRNALGISGNFRAKNPNQNPNGAFEFLYVKYSDAVSAILRMLDDVDSADLNSILKSGVRILNAFLCGVWNGLIDAISGLVLMVKYVFDAIALMNDFMDNIQKELPILLEHFDNVVQAAQQINFSKIIDYLKKGLTSLASNISAIRVAYFSGAVTGFIISLVIEIAAGILLTGGALSVEVIIERLAGMLKSIVMLIPNLGRFAIKITRASIRTLYKMLSEITVFLSKGTDEIIKIIDNLFIKLKATTILSTETVLVYAEFIPISRFFKFMKLTPKQLWIKQLEKIGFQIAKIAEDEYIFVHNGIEIFRGSKQEANEVLKYYFSTSRRQGLVRYLDDLADLTKKRKIALEMWIHKIDKTFYNHINGEFGIGKIERKTIIPYKDEFLVANGGHTSEAVGKSLKIKGRPFPDSPVYNMPYKAKIKVKYRDGWLLKDDISSMFPKNWKLARIEEEVALVYENTVHKGIGLNPSTMGKPIRKFKGRGTGNFDVLIEVDIYDNIVNAYPII